MSEGINNRILIIKGILAEKCGLNPDIYDEISEIFEEIQILDKAKDDALVFEREQKLSEHDSNCNKPAVSKSLKCDCKHSGSCRYEIVIAESKELCRYKV